MSERTKVELICGDWRARRINGRVHSVITDVPYSERTIEGQRSIDDGEPQTAIKYEPWTRVDCTEFCRKLIPIVDRWLVVFCDHVVWQWLASELDAQQSHDPREWITFPPVPWVKTDAAPNFTGTGPSSQSESIFVARPRGAVVRRFRPGYYVTRQDRAGIVVGGKPVPLMRKVIRDYSEKGDLIFDPCAGGASTLIAGRLEGRHVVGCERDPETYAAAANRIAAPYVPDLFAGQ